jgi:class 3 adenylate cyclase
MKNTMKEYNANHKDAKDHIGVSGYGIHQGEILFFQGTDIHWGDPVNTSSKLGQDLAQDGDILIMPCIYENAMETSYFQKLEFTEKTL